MKLLVLFLVLATVLYAEALKKGIVRHFKFNYGKLDKNDRLLEEYRVKKDFYVFGQQTEHRNFPANGEYDVPISYIKIEDLISNGNYRTAMILEGGVGHKFAKMFFRSNQMRGFDYIIEIYGPQKA